VCTFIFYLLGPADDSKEKIKIMDANLFITQAELNPSIFLAQAKVLSQVGEWLLLLQNL
jgi:hypothetical protein